MSYVRILIRPALSENHPIKWRDLIAAFPDLFPRYAPVKEWAPAAAPTIAVRPRKQINAVELKKRYRDWRTTVGMPVSRTDGRPASRQE
jgi:hypothetical protein